MTRPYKIDSAKPKGYRCKKYLREERERLAVSTALKYANKYFPKGETVEDMCRKEGLDLEETTKLVTEGRQLLK